MYGWMDGDVKCDWQIDGKVDGLKGGWWLNRPMDGWMNVYMDVACWMH